MDFICVSVTTLAQLFALRQVLVPPEVISEAENAYLVPSHSVLRLAPPSFLEVASRIYGGMGNPAVTSQTFWQIYQDMLTQFEDAIVSQRISGLLVREWASEVVKAGLEDDQAVVEDAEGEVGRFMSEEDLQIPPHGFVWGSDEDLEDSEGQILADFSDEGSESEGKEWVVQTLLA